MHDYKNWYQSKTVWGGLIAVAAPLLGVAGMPLDVGSQGELADILATLAGAIGGLVAIWGRLTANSTIR